MTDDLDFDLDDGDDEDSVGSDRELEAIQNRFVAKVDNTIKVLVSSRNVTKRRDAALWLGESGEPKAIPALKNVYKDDRNKEVRDAAKYALGMFKALDDALNGTEKERDHALELVQDIILKGKRGQRSPLSPAILTRIQVGLAVVLVILVALNILVPVLRSVLANSGQQVAVKNTPTPAPSADPVLMVSDVRTLLTQISDDSRALQRQFLTIRRGETADCTLVFNDPQPYTVPAELVPFFPDVVDMVNLLDSNLSTLQEVRATFENACQEGAEPLAVEAVDAPLESVTAILQDLRGLDERLNTANEQAGAFTPPAPTDVPVVTDAPLATDVPTIPPTATLSVFEVRSHVNRLDSIITDARSVRGPIELLTQYWADVRQSGGTGGCRIPTPEIPTSYDLTDEANTFFPPEISQPYPELEDAAAQIDLGLKLLNDGWTLFETSCQNGTLVDQSNTGEQYMSAVTVAFDGATTSLSTLSARLNAGG